MANLEDITNSDLETSLVDAKEAARPYIQRVDALEKLLARRIQLIDKLREEAKNPGERISVSLALLLRQAGNYFNPQEMEIIESELGMVLLRKMGNR